MKRKFDFEKHYNVLLQGVNQLKDQAEQLNFNLEQELQGLEAKMEILRKTKYAELTPWEKTLLSRHIERPGTIDFIQRLFTDWTELHGDRLYGDDPAILGGIARLNDLPVTVIGHQKGKNVKDNMRMNYGMPNPEGYRKTLRLIQQAEKFKRPVIMFIDTPGAHPGVGAEERGQAWAISQLLMVCAYIRVPIISIITGEGGSGGALALAVGDRLYMLKHAIFSVASPEACASIIWKDPERAPEMAEQLKITAEDLLKFEIIDGIIEEPIGGAHTDPDATAELVKSVIVSSLQTLIPLDETTLLEQRYQRLRKIGSQSLLS